MSGINASNHDIKVYFEYLPALIKRHKNGKNYTYKLTDLQIENETKDKKLQVSF